ncbi:alanyl-tRNA editing protein [Caproiciproducens sp. LBM24188]|nr:hypothetical protein [Clostridiales bacterium]
MTEKLYDCNPYLRTFTAKVLSCTPKGEHYEVVLNRTAFFPEGGGQPSDIGVLNTVNVLDVHECGGEIIHTTDRSLAAGTTVTGGINWTHRFDCMQQHSGEHIVSGIVHRFFGYDNVGFHLGSKVVTVDFNGEFTGDQLTMVETLANEAVYKNIPVKAEYPSAEQLASMAYRSKKELSGAIRIVSVPGYDVCACCGTHVARTGEIGMIRLISAQRYKGGTRITLVCGRRALEDYREKAQSVNAISVLLSAKPEEVFSATERLQTEFAALKQQTAELQNQIFEYKASSVPEGTEKLCLFEENLLPNDLRRFGLLLCEKCSDFAAVLSGSDEDGYKYAVCSSSNDVRPLGKKLNEAFGGRGGGSKELVQGSVRGTRNDIERFFNEKL